jgi:ubiquinone/menaquinone biosynthesis C-methylase UbiE
MLSVFDERWKEYDEWYDRHRDIFLKELELIERNLPDGYCLEVGVGTGRFASCLGCIGIDISLNMLKLAKKRGVDVVLADALNLPFRQVFDIVLLAFTLCFLEKPVEALIEASKVLRNNGRILICIVRGKLIEDYRKKNSPFYRAAKFYSVEDVSRMLERTGFFVEKIDFTDLKYGRDVALIVGRK